MRSRRRGSHGLSLFGSLLAMALLGSLILGVVVWLEERALEDRARLAGSKLETLAHAVSSYVHSNFRDLQLRVPAGSPQTTITAAELSAVLPEGFSPVDALGRGYRVMAMRAGTTGVDVLVAQTLPAGDAFVPSAALLGERYGGVRMGVVAPEASTRLRGPAIDVDVSAFQTAFSGVPAVGALAAFGRFDHQNVFGDMLYRIEIPGFPDANRMETALHLGGNDIAGAGLVEAQSFDVEEDIEVNGALEVEGELTVGEAVTVTGEVTVGGAMTAGSGEFDGLVKADTVEAETSMETVTVTASGTVTAETVSATGAMTANSATIGDLQSATMDAQTVTATNVTAENVSLNTMRATGSIAAATAGISRLTVGSCSGC